MEREEEKDGEIERDGERERVKGGRERQRLNKSKINRIKIN